ncbi:hypothetical protein CFP56_036573 [Quercus suber]|uniref:Uncharacterized protein n=1 Tax=Quercus suber TaxID=58331 RepID=A0AAW0J6K3_QUESU
MELGWLLPGPNHLQSKIKPLSSNIYPLQQHLDKDIWKDAVAEDRENWSIGQLTAVPVLASELGHFSKSHRPTMCKSPMPPCHHL